MKDKGEKEPKQRPEAETEAHDHSKWRRGVEIRSISSELSTVPAWCHPPGASPGHTQLLPLPLNTPFEHQLFSSHIWSLFSDSGLAVSFNYNKIKYLGGKWDY